MSSNRYETRIGGFAEEFELVGERKLYLVLETVCWDGELDFNCRGAGLVFRWQVLVREHEVLELELPTTGCQYIYRRPL